MARLNRWTQTRILLAVILGGVLGGEGVATPSRGDHCGVTKSESSGGRVLVFRPDAGCKGSEVQPTLYANDLLTALTSGKGLDLADLALAGVLDFNTLPLVPVESLDPGLTRASWLQEKLPNGLIHAIAGSLSMRNVSVVDLWDAHPDQARVVFQGPVIITDTIFQQLVDCSRVWFLGTVNFSRNTFQHEAYFVQARFDQEARFEDVRFGPRARFHRAHFHAPVTFQRTDFRGMGEFLEVVFEKDATFSEAVFHQGTGFSGSTFKAVGDFSRASFRREAFFTYTIFERDAVFRETTFDGQADFSFARFQGADEFFQATFAKEPRLEGVVGVRQLGQHGLSQGSFIEYVIAAAGAGCLVIVLYVVRRLAQSGASVPPA